MRKRTVFFILALGSLLSRTPPGLAEEAAAAEQGCSDPVFSQTKVRIDELTSVKDRLLAWDEFLLNYADHPCAAEARRLKAALEASEEKALEDESRREWKQEARGGVVDPAQREFPLHLVFPDGPPVHRLRLTNEVITLTDGWKADVGDIRQVNMKGDALWTMVLRGEAALVSHLGLTCDLPFAAADIEDDRFRWAMGNVAIGLRGIWGKRLADETIPWVISGGIIWGSGTSLWSGAKNRPLLEAAAIGGAHQRHLFRYDSPDYAVHLSSQWGFGAHFLGLALAHHTYAGGEHVEQITRIDLAYDWRVLDWLTLGLEVNMGVGEGEAVAGTTSGNESLFFTYLSPGARVDLGLLNGSLAFRVPLADARDWARLITSLEIGMRF